MVGKKRMKGPLSAQSFQARVTVCYGPPVEISIREIPGPVSPPVASVGVGWGTGNSEPIEDPPTVLISCETQRREAG